MNCNLGEAKSQIRAALYDENCASSYHSTCPRKSQLDVGQTMYSSSFTPSKPLISIVSLYPSVCVTSFDSRRGEDGREAIQWDEIGRAAH